MIPSIDSNKNLRQNHPKFKQLRKAVEEFRTYIVNNRHLIPNYGVRYRNGDAFVKQVYENLKPKS